MILKKVFTGSKVYVVLDACHMLKLFRNLLGDKRMLHVPGFSNYVYFEHFVLLQSIQVIPEVKYKKNNPADFI